MFGVSCVAAHPTVAVAVYVVVHLLTYHIMVNVLSKRHFKFHKNQEVLEKYEPFSRTDVGQWGMWKNLPQIMTFWPRAAILLVNVSLYCFLVRVLMIGVDMSNPKIGPTRHMLIKRSGQVVARTQAFLFGMVWLKVDHVSTGEGDYRKWLGPDWKPQWEGSGTIVSNHVCWADIVIALVVFFPSFVSKSSVKKYPFIGSIACAIDSVFLDRTASKEEKVAAAKKIEERQRENEENGRSPILIFPEGATTNNKSLIKFKRGPFAGLNSVQPICYKYFSPNGISMQNDTVLQNHYYWVFMSYFVIPHLKVYPVFKPNEYFWKHHYDESSGLSKWETYAKVVREEIMAKSFNFELADIAVEDKFDFKKIIKGKKKDA